MSVADTSAPARTIDPRLRARRIAVRRDEGRRRLRRLSGLGAVAGVAVLTFAVTRSPALDVDRVQVAGAQHTSADAVQRASGIRHHAPMTDLDLDKARRGVLALPWVRTVSITRSWPGTVRIVVTERTAIAAIAAGNAGFSLVDDEGRVLESTTTLPAGYVLLVNVASPGEPGTTVDASAADALAVARGLPASLRAKVSAIVPGDDGVTLRLVAGGVVRLGDAGDLTAKLRAADTVLNEADTKNLCTVDVRVAAAPSLTRGKPCLYFLDQH